MALAMLLRMVFNTLASPASPLPTSSKIPLAKPTSRAGAIIIRAPSVKDEAMVLTVMPLRRKTTPMMPITRPMVKNWLAISGINQALTITPQITQTITAVRTINTSQSPKVNGRCSTSACFSRKKRSDSCTRDRRGFFFTREAYTMVKIRPIRVAITHTTMRNPEPESTGTPAIP